MWQLALIASIGFAAGVTLWWMIARMEESRRETLKYLRLIGQHEARIQAARGGKFTHPN